MHPDHEDRPRCMLWLPPIQSGSTVLWFPLDPGSLPAILTGIGSAELATRANGFEHALVSDSLFMTWVACRWPGLSMVNMDRQLVCDGLAQQDPRCFTPVDRDIGEVSRTVWRVTWLPLIRSSQRRRQFVDAATGGPERSGKISRARRLALLSLTREIVAAASMERQDPARFWEQVLLPTDLRSFLAGMPPVPPQLDAQADGQVAEWVLQSVGITYSAPLEPARSCATPTASESPVASGPEGPPAAPTTHMADDWPLTPAWPAIVPEWFARLARLRELEQDFAAQLQAAKLQAMRDFAYGASHEINNPLANISSRAQTLLLDEKDPERRKKLATINAQAFRAFEMIADVMLFAKPPRIDPHSVDLLACLERALQELAEDAEQQGTELRRGKWLEQCAVQADEDQLLVAFKALLRNALEAVASDGWIEVEMRLVDAAPWGSATVEISVTDNGPGVPESVRGRIFDPFFSGRESGRGLGLGLSKCWRIIELLNGQIRHEEPAMGGARFVIRLPLPASTEEWPAGH